MKLINSNFSNKNIKFYFDTEKNMGEYKQLKICFFYDLGNYNYYTGKESKRGYYVSLTPCEVSTINGFTYFKETLFQGIKFNLKETSRFSKKQFIGAAMSLNMDTLIRLCYEIGLYLDTTVIYEMYKIVKKEIENLL